ncbi:MAG: hypothetical protein MZV70_55940 [Desulfobacterales bacterium]|nr:hypothetical protein [Desulfobacterales bacterium]
MKVDRPRCQGMTSKACRAATTSAGPKPRRCRLGTRSEQRYRDLGGSHERLDLGGGSGRKIHLQQPDGRGYPGLSARGDHRQNTVRFHAARRGRKD